MILADVNVLIRAFREDAPEVSVFSSGDHWDLFDGSRMVADGSPIRNNSHPGKLFFWAAP